MNDKTFSIPRFRAVLRKYMADNRSRLTTISLLTLALMIAIGIGNAMVYADDPQYRGGSQLEFILMMTSTLLIGCWLASTMFTSLSRVSTAASTLTLPATAIEQVAARWLVAVPMFLAWALVCAVIGDIAKVLFSHYVLHTGLRSLPWFMFLTGNRVYTLGGHELYLWLLAILAIQSFYLFGGVIFSSHHYMKTSLAVIVIIAVFNIAIMIVTEWITYLSAQIFSSSLWPMLIDTLPVILVNYWLTWMRFKESEVINRW